jgi:hypothetical protein
LPARETRAGQPFEGFGEGPREAAAFLGDPAFEFVGAGEIDAVEEGTAADARGSGVVTGADRVPEESDIARDRLRVQAKLRDAGDGFGIAELAAYLVEELLERAPGTGSRALGPEQQHRLLAREPALPGRRDRGEQPERPALRGQDIRRAAIPLQHEPAERAQNVGRHDEISPRMTVR